MKTIMFNTIVALSFSVLNPVLGLQDKASAQSEPGPGQVFINDVRYGGSGCPAGSVSGSISADLKAIIVDFDSLIAEIGPGIPLVDSRKNCQLMIDVHVPQGWRYAIVGLETLGFMNLESGVTGTQTNRYYFQGSATSGTLTSRFVGPRVGDYRLRDNIALSSQVWSPCNAQRALNINVQVRLQGASNRRGLLTVDELRGVSSRRYFVAWNRCH